MDEKIRRSLLVGILCIMGILIIWGLASPPTTIEFPNFTHT
ncbi:hypothetical protein SAMN05216342_0201 [Exiguobacterium indicum]|nr:hypothetical protein SAMN05216342_0201 [Exiguobacterium enclense]